MKGKITPQKELVCFINVEDRIPADHPIRPIKRMVGELFQRMGPVLEGMYSEMGRPSTPPERLLGAQVLMMLYSVRSARQFCERLRYDLLFQWFLEMNPDEGAFDHSVFSKNQERLLEHEAAKAFFEEVGALAVRGGWASLEHFSVDGTLIEAWASLKSFREKGAPPEAGGKGGNPWADFKGEKRANDTHESRTDPEAKLIRKGAGKEAKLCFAAHAVMENRNGLLMDLKVTPAVGAPEGPTAVGQLADLKRRGLQPKSAGADKGYHNKAFVGGCRANGIRPHVAQMSNRKVEGLDGRTTRTEGYRLSQQIRKRIEEIFGWLKTTGGLRKSRYKGVARTQLCAWLTGAAYNLLRLAKLAFAKPLPSGA